MSAIIIIIITTITEPIFSFCGLGEAWCKKARQVQGSPSVFKFNIHSQPRLPCSWEAPGIQSDWLVPLFHYLYELLHVLNVVSVSLFPNNSYSSEQVLIWVKQAHKSPGVVEQVFAQGASPAGCLVAELQPSPALPSRSSMPLIFAATTLLSSPHRWGPQGGRLGLDEDPKV